MDIFKNIVFANRDGSEYSDCGGYDGGSCTSCEDW